MRPWASTVAAAALLAAGAAGCSDEEPAARPSAQTVDAESTASAAELAGLRQRAGIAPCPLTRPGVRPLAGGLPELALPCLGGGREVWLPGLRDSPTVLNVWATWCGPCRDELPLLQRLHERAGGDVRVVGVDIEDPNEGMALAYAAEAGLTYPQLRDLDQALPTALGLRAVPLTLFIDARGRVEHTLLGPVRSSRQLAGLVEQHLGVMAR